MVAKKRKGIVKKGLRRSEQGINPLLVALGAGAGAAGGAGMAARKAAAQKKRIPSVAERVSARARAGYDSLNEQSARAMRNSDDAFNMGLGYARSDQAGSRGKSSQQYGIGIDEKWESERINQRASRLKDSGKMDAGYTAGTIKSRLAATKPRAARYKIKRGAVRGAIKGGAMAALAAAVLAEINKKKD
jgi:hypothetical protein